MTESRAVPRSFVLSSMVIALMGATLLIRTLATSPPGRSLELGLVLLAALLSENFALSLPTFNVSMAFPLIVAAFVLTGPSGGALVGAMCFTNYEEIKSRRPLPPVAHNFGQLVIAGYIGGRVYTLLGGAVLSNSGGFDPMPPAALPRSVVALMLASFVVFAVNLVLTAYAVSALRGQGFSHVVGAMMAYVPTQTALAFVGLLIAQVLAISPLAFPLFLFPLILARQIYQRYANMREVYLDTVRSLVGALEAKDPYTRGHSERVAQYAAAIGEAMTADERAIERLQREALLHDMGKLAMSTTILAKPAALSDDEFESMRRHPDVGADMVGRIAPLRGLAEVIRAHHERVDGHGYPRQLKAEEIPLDARILAVADSYDAMTTNRSYRSAMSHDAAVNELVSQAGSQFDSQVVQAFIAGDVGIEAGGPVADEQPINSAQYLLGADS